MKLTRCVIILQGIHLERLKPRLSCLIILQRKIDVASAYSMLAREGENH